MATSRTHTLLSIDEWAAILGVSPWDVNQFRYPGNKSAQCQDVIYQYAWQKDHLSREEIGEAIASAERMLADELMYWPAPHYEVDEPVTYTRPHQPQLFGFAGTPRGEWKSFGTRWHKVIKGGVLNRTLIGTIDGSAIATKDLDNDGVRETFIMTITDASIATITDVNEIAIYFTEDDRHGEPLDETWRIRPVRISVSGTTATITGHRALLGNPTSEYAVDASPMNAGEDGNYVNSAVCYRTFIDDTATDANPYQGVAKWSTIPGCTDGCTFQIKPLCIGQVLNEQGQVSASFGMPCDWPYSREPDALQVNYLSGVPLVNGRMENQLAKMVAYLSVSLLANEKCGCERTNRILDKLRAPFLKFVDNSAGAESYQEGTNTFPMTYGAQWAYTRVRGNRHIEVVGI